MKLDTIVVLFFLLSAFVGSLYVGMMTEALIFLIMTCIGVAFAVYERNFKNQ